MPDITVENTQDNKVLMALLIRYPNDMDLGRAVRHLYTNKPIQDDDETDQCTSHSR